LPGGGGALWSPPRSPARPLAEALAWLWRLGPVLDEARPGAVGLATGEEAATLEKLLRGGRIAGAVVLCGGPDAEDPGLPKLARVRGRASFSEATVSGPFCVFQEGDPVVRSSLGAHAVVRRGLLFLGADPGGWGRVSEFWVVPLLARFFVETLDRPLALLPAVGCLRWDDVPGTAQHQLEGRAQSDRAMARRLARLVPRYRRGQARLVVAVASSALVDGQEVPLEEAWPRSLAVLRAGVAASVLEPACHGTLHLDAEALARGVVDPREFARLSAAEAGRRLDRALDWMRRSLGEPASFVAPAWAYSAGTLQAARERGLPIWRPPRPGSLLDGGELYETLGHSLRGIVGLDYRALTSLAAVGLPPTVVLHGGLLDHRLSTLHPLRDISAILRLLVSRDLDRLPFLSGIRWVGAGDLARELASHAEVATTGSWPTSSEGRSPARLLTRRGLVTLR